MDEITIQRPDDWHLHIRDGAIMAAVLPHTAALFGRAIIMPNLVPPIRNLDDARAYRARIMERLPDQHPFQPLMTLYLTETTDVSEIRRAGASGDVTAVKLYPAGATTNSDSGVAEIRNVYPVLEAMQAVDLPLLVHGEVTDPAVDVFDREAVFIERVLTPLRRQFPDLRIVFEHITSKHAVDFVLAADAKLAATITPHHLMINRNALFQGGLRPHMYCLPVAKREESRQALRRAAASGDRRFFLGTDSAPHPIHLKETDCGCAGIYNAPTALACTAQVFDEEGALDALEGFVARHGADFYGLPANRDHITLTRTAATPPDDVVLENHGRIRVFWPDQAVNWTVTAGLRAR